MAENSADIKKREVKALEEELAEKRKESYQKDFVTECEYTNKLFNDINDNLGEIIEYRINEEDGYTKKDVEDIISSTDTLKNSVTKIINIIGLRMKESNNIKKEINELEKAIAEKKAIAGKREKGKSRKNIFFNLFGKRKSVKSR